MTQQHRTHPWLVDTAIAGLLGGLVSACQGSNLDAVQRASVGAPAEPASTASAATSDRPKMSCTPEMMGSASTPVGSASPSASGKMSCTPGMMKGGPR